MGAFPFVRDETIVDAEQRLAGRIAQEEVLVLVGDQERVRDAGDGLVEQLGIALHRDGLLGQLGDVAVDDDRTLVPAGLVADRAAAGNDVACRADPRPCGR